MTEAEYIIATNLARVRTSINALRETLGGEEWGLPDELRKTILKELYDCERVLSAKIDIAMMGE